jgi:hypothetical protein
MINPDDTKLKLVEIMSRNIYEWTDRSDYDPFRTPCTQNIIDSSRRIRKRVCFAQPLIPDLPLEIFFEIFDFSGLQGNIEFRNCVSNRHSGLLLTLTGCFELD